MSEASAAGVVSVRSPLAFAKTVQNLLIAIERRGMMLFARIDHAKEAAKVGVALKPATLFIFGYADAEAPLIAANPLLAVNFPQRFLVREDEQGHVWMSYADPVALGRRFGVCAESGAKLSAIRVSLAGIAAEASGAARA